MVPSLKGVVLEVVDEPSVPSPVTSEEESDSCRAGQRLAPDVGEDICSELNESETSLGDNGVFHSGISGDGTSALSDHVENAVVRLRRGELALGVVVIALQSLVHGVAVVLLVLKVKSGGLQRPE